MKNIINIGVVNFTTVWGDKETNLNRILGYTEAAGKQGVEFLVFPETALTGYDNDLAHDDRRDKMHCVLAEPIPGPSTEKVAALAKKYGMYVVFGMPERSEGQVYNSAAIIAPDGTARSYRKLHLPFDEKEWAVRGEDPVLIDTPWGPVGITICYDTYCFPELIRYYRSKGARLCLNVTACPDAPCTFGAAKLAIPAYAFINYVYIASANLTGPDLRSHFVGGSSVVGPDSTKGGVQTYVGTMFGEDGAELPGLKAGTVDLSLCDLFTDIPIFRKDEKGACDFRKDLYARLYRE